MEDDDFDEEILVVEQYERNVEPSPQPTLEEEPSTPAENPVSPRTSTPAEMPSQQDFEGSL
jgi:hypothetical protein